MTIATTDSVAGPFDGNDVATSFPFTNVKVLQNSDLEVYYVDSDSVETLLVESTDYTLVLNSDQDASPGGTITYPVSGSPLATGDKLYGKRIVDHLQGMDLSNQSKYDAEVVEDAADKTIMQIQQLKEELVRSLKLPGVEAGTDLVLPTLSDRLSKFLAFDASGNPVATSMATTALIVTTFMESLLDDANASDALATLGAAGLADNNIFSGINTFNKTQYLKKGADIASANDMVLLPDGNDNDITGSVDVNGMTDGIANETRQFHADDIFTLKHNTAASSGFSSLHIVQGEADITTAAGDEWKARYDGTVWRIFDYNRADGIPIFTAEVGDIIIRPRSVVPNGFLECDGSAISRTTYAALFADISTEYGVGDGSTTFNIPDFRGEFLRGWDHGAGNDPDRASRTDRGDGTTGDNVGTKQGHELDSHTHSIPTNNSSTPANGYAQASDGGSTNFSATTGGAGGNETRPRNVNVMYCIKY